MKTSYSFFKTTALILFLCGATVACETVYKPTVAQQPYYSMSTDCAGQVVFSPVNSGATSSCGMNTCSIGCHTSRATVYTTPTGNAYKVGSYPSYQYYNSSVMPTYGTYYYKMGPSYRY